MTKLGGNQSLVRKTNLRLILDLVKKQGPISRAELAKKLKLSAPSVSSNIDQLLQMDVLREIGEGDSGGGRKPILLELNAGAGYVLGIDLSSENCKVALGNLKGEIVCIKQFSLPKDKDGEKIISKILETIEEIYKAHAGVKESLKAVAIGTPGVVDPDTNAVRFSPQFKGWDNIPIKDIFKEYCKVPVLLKNDINLAALGEANYGAGKGSKNQAYISVDIGIGAGIILNKKLFEGSNLAAGEIGYMISDFESVNECRDGYGSLEAKASVPALLDNLNKELDKGKKSILKHWINSPEELNLNHVKRALDSGDELTQSVVYSTVRLLFIAIANLQAILNLDLIIIGGEIRLLGDYLLDPINEFANKAIPIKPEIIYSELNSKAGVYGAFAIALEYVFKHIAD